MPGTDDISPALQDYLELILTLSKERGSARVTDIAGSLSNAKPSVTQALNHLKSHGFVEKEPYSPVKLTSKGLRYAARIRYRHTVLHEFLVTVLKVDEETAEADACRMEHVLSEQTMEHLIAFANRWSSTS